MPLANLNLDMPRLVALCRRYGVVKLEAFGSTARGDAGTDSDVDLLVTYDSSHRSGFEFVALQQELEALVGRHVDLLTRASVEKSPNKYFRRFALQHTEPVYVCA